MSNLEVALKLKIAQTGLENIQNLIGELKAAGAETDAFEQQAAALADEIRRLQAEQGLIDQFKQIKGSVGDAADEMAKAKAETADLAVSLKNAEANAAQWRKALQDARNDESATTREIRDLSRALKQSEQDVRSQASAFERARSSARSSEKTYQTQRLELQQLRREMSDAGISASSLAKNQTRINQSSEALHKQEVKLVQALKSEATALRQVSAEGDQAVASHRKISDGVQSISHQLDAAQRNLLAFISVQQGLSAAENLGHIADDYKNLVARIKLAIGANGDLDQAISQVSKTALDTGQNLLTVGELYASLARNAGLSQEKTAALTDTISKATALSGGSAESANAAIIQLNQSLASGVFRGDEFNSVMEQAPIIGDAIAKSLKVTRGELRNMANQGQLTAEVVIKALLEQKDTLDAQYAQMPQTIGRAMENIRTQWTLYIGEVDKANGYTAKAAELLNSLAGNLDTVASLATVAGEALLAGLATKGIAAIFGYGKAIAAAIKETGSLTAAIKRIPASVYIAVLVVGMEAANAAAKYLAENYSEAGKAAKEAQAKTHAWLLEHRHDLQETIIALDQYKNTQLKTSEELAAMSAQERQDYDYKIAASRRYYLAQINLANVQKQLGEKVTADAQAARKRLDELKLGADAVANQISVGAQQMVNQLGQATAAGKDLDQALSNIAEHADLGSATGIKAFGQFLRQAQQDGTLSAQQVETAWSKALAKLSNQDLVLFAQSAQLAFGKTAKDVAAQASAMTASIHEAARRAGVDIPAALDELTPGVQKALSNIDALQMTLETTGYTAQQQATIIATALKNAVDGAKTDADLLAITNRFKQMGDVGGQAAKVIVSGVEEARKKLADLHKEQADMNDALAAAVDAGVSGSVGKMNMDDVVALIQRAQANIESGNAELGRSQAKMARQAIGSINQQGGADIRQLQTYLQAAKDLTQQSYEAQVNTAQKQFDQFNQSMKKAAEPLQNLPVGFDEQHAQTAASALIKNIQAQLQNNPIVVPVTVQTVNSGTPGSGSVNQAVRQAADLYGSTGR